jgi:hypothetical protein
LAVLARLLRRVASVAALAAMPADMAVSLVDAEALRAVDQWARQVAFPLLARFRALRVSRQLVRAALESQPVL